MNAATHETMIKKNETEYLYLLPVKSAISAANANTIIKPEMYLNR